MWPLLFLRRCARCWLNTREGFDDFHRTDQAPEDDWESTVPATPARDDRIMVEESSSSIHLSSSHVHRSDATSSSPLTMGGGRGELAPHLLDGAWQVVQRDAWRVALHVRFFFIDGRIMTTSDMNIYTINTTSAPNTLHFGDATGEVVSEDIFELTLATMACVRYNRMQLPHRSILSFLHGTWTWHSNGVCQADSELKFLGPCVEIRKKDEVMHALLHVRRDDGSMMLCNSVVEVHVCGSLFLLTASGKLLKYVRRFTGPIMDAIPELVSQPPE